MDIVISEKIANIVDSFNVGVIEFDAEVYEEKKIDKYIEQIESEIKNNIDILDVVNLDIIKNGRNAYKKFGKDPSRYRLAVESLYRRLSKGNRLYRINNVVDLGNLISLKSRRSVAVLDYDKIEGNILIRLGLESDIFRGIGRGKINIKDIPVYVDNIGPFGSTTSDTERTMISADTSKILLFIISFNGENNLLEELEYTKDLYEKFAKGKNFKTYII